MFYSNLFIIFGTTEFQIPLRAKKDRQNSWRNRGRQRGAIRFKHKNSGLSPILQCYGTKKFMELHSNTVKSQALDCWKMELELYSISTIYYLQILISPKKIANVLLDYPD